MCMTHIDLVKVHVETRRKARKLHHCYECRNEIRPGDAYREDTGIDHDGHPFRHRTCLSCVRIRDWLGAEMAAKRLAPNGHVDECGQWVWGELSEACEEALADWADEHGRCRYHYWQPRNHVDCDD